LKEEEKKAKPRAKKTEAPAAKVEEKVEEKPVKVKVAKAKAEGAKVTKSQDSKGRIAGSQTL